MSTRPRRAWLAVALVTAIAGSVRTARATTIAYTSETAFDAALASAPAQIGFEDLKPGDVLTNQYAALDVVFSPYGSAPAYPTVQPYIDTFAPHSGTQQMETVPVGYGGGGFVATFATPVAGVGMYVGGLQFVTDTLEILDANGASLGTYDMSTTFGTDAYSYVFVGVTSDVGIGSIRVSIDHGLPEDSANPAGDYVWFDDFRIGPAAPPPPPATVPEPGLAGLAAMAILQCLIRKGDRKGGGQEGT